MLDSEKERFSVGLRALASMFRVEVTEALIAGYWMGLQDLELRLVGHAMRAAIRECEQMPPPAKLRAFARHASVVAGKTVEEARAERRQIEAEKAAIRSTWPRALEPVRGGGG